MKVVTAISVGLNAFLVHQLYVNDVLFASNSLSNTVTSDSCQAATETEKETETQQCGSVAELISKVGVDEIIQAGQLFFNSKVSEILMPTDVQNILNFNNRSWGQEQPATGLALELLQVPLSKKEKEEKQLEKKTVENLVERMDKHGVLVIPSLVDKATCQEMAKVAHQEILNPDYEFGGIQQNEYRKDYPLKLEGLQLRILEDTVKMLKPFLAETLGLDGHLIEFSSLTAYPGAKAQHFHGDSSVDKPEELSSLAKLYSAFIYLDDIGADVAPFDVRPGTHTHYQFLSRDEQDMMESVPFARLQVPVGSIAIYDSRTIHRGGPNRNEKLIRPTLYFSILESRKPAPDGPTYSLRDSYNHKNISVQDLVQDDIPEEIKTRAQESHDDKKCLESIIRICGDTMKDERDSKNEKTRQCVEETVRSSAQKLFKMQLIANSEAKKRGETPLEPNVEKVDINQDAFPGCSLMSRIEKLANIGVFSPSSKSFVTWGEL